VIDLEMKLKDKLKGSGLYGTMKNVGAIYQRVTDKLSVKTSGVAVASSTPYEVSEAHKVHMLELERKRSQISTEAYRQNPR